MTWSVLVVGLGQIGMGYDLSLDPEAYVLTHARAFAGHEAFELVGAVELDPEKREAFEAHYVAPAFSDVTTAMRVLSPDVVAIATPTALHAETVRAVLGGAVTPRAILCEKPLAYELSDARLMLDEAQEKKCAVYVNYMRRAEPGVIEVKARLLEGSIGAPYKGVVWYSKGLFNNGSHFLNLLQYWLGDVSNFQIIDQGRRWGGDPEPDFTLSFGDQRIFFIAAREENFSHYTIELIGSNGRLRYEKGGEDILWQGLKNDPAFSGYTILDGVGTKIETDYDRVQWHVVDQLARSMKGFAAHICTGAEALNTIEVLTAIKEKLCRQAS